MRRRRRALRDQAETPFAVMLEDLLDNVPFVRGAAIVDFEGETVDYAGEIDPFELRVAAATMQLVLADVRECPKLGEVLQLNMALGRGGYILRVLDPSYSLLVMMRKLGTFFVSQRLLLEMEARFLAEASLPIVRKPSFFHVEVATQGRGQRVRPERVRLPASAHLMREGPSDWMPVEVLGALVGLAPGERGFRVRLPTGAEVNLLRDVARVWFTDEPLEALMKEVTAAQKADFVAAHPFNVKPNAR